MSPTPSPPLAAELTLARQAAAEAAAILQAREGAEAVREKSPGNLVTAIDEAAERAIIARIRAHFPHDAIVAEESAASVRAPGRRWIIDPVDGTVNYVHAHPFACVSIAFADEAGPAAGVIHAPFLGEVFHAVRGGGAYLNDRPIRVSATADGHASLLATGFPFKPGKGDPARYMALVAELVPSTHGIRRAGSAALDLAFVACGRMDGYFELGIAPWDVAAGMLLVTEAGGRVSGWPGDQADPLDSGRILVSNGHIHTWLEERVGGRGL